MNRNRYRLIFDKRTGTLIPVAEFTTASNLSTGTLVLGVQWGKVKGWRFKGEAASGFRERATQWMLPGVEGEVLNIRAIDQAVESLNTAHQSAQVNIAPADETGWSWLDVNVVPRLPIGGNLGVDNSGTSDKVGDGRFRSTVGVAVRGFGADTWNLGGTRRHYYDGHVAMEESRNLSVSMPLGYWNAEWRRGDSRYQRTIKSMFGSYASQGSSSDLSLKVGRTVARSKRGKTDVSLRVQRKDNENFIGTTRLDVNSKVYTDLVLGASRVDQLLGGSLYADVNWSRGTRWLGANDVVMDRVSGNTPALYYKFSGNVSWNRAFPVGARRLDLAMRGGWQYSPRDLLSANKLTIGDEFTVRGFKNNAVYGDKGVYLSNTVTMTMFGGVSAFVGADVGMVTDNGPVVTTTGFGNNARTVVTPSRDVVISGWAAGLRGNWRNASIGLTYAQPIKTPTPLAKDEVLYATASVRF